MIGFAVINCNLTREEFLNLTPKEYEPINKEAVRRIREPWEQMRTQTMYLVNIQLAKTDRIWNEKRFMPFAWEMILSDEELERIKNIDWKALDRKYGKSARKSDL